MKIPVDQQFLKYSDQSVWHQQPFHVQSHLIPFLPRSDARFELQFAEDKQTKDMDYWNNVLWSDETKINLFGSDGVKRVWR